MRLNARVMLLRSRVRAAVAPRAAVFARGRFLSSSAEPYDVIVIGGGPGGCAPHRDLNLVCDNWK